jgi:hypothetical protein
LYFTVDHTAYASLDLMGKHEIIAHRMEEYVALKIEHQDDDNELLKYLRKQAGLYQD